MTIGRAGSRRGSVAIEYAIILPALLMLLLGLVDSGRLVWSNTTLAHAVEAASRCAAVNVSICGSSTAIQSYAASQAWGLGLNSSAFTVTSVTCGIQVVGTMPFTFVIPWTYVAAPFGASNAITLNAMSCYPA